VGDKRFIISAKWWERWCQFVSYDDDSASSSGTLVNAAPSKINNMPLLHISSDTKLDELMGGPLRSQLKENYHYVLLPQEVWDALLCWYGGGPTIARFVMEVGDPTLGNSFKQVQVYPVRIALWSCTPIFLQSCVTIFFYIDRRSKPISKLMR
jgi:hypothetical protein